jgi:ABC-2 type transport system ATP-binding protein
MTGVVDAIGVTKRYGEVLGLNGFTAQFGAGITGLVGPNGSGKSTLFRLLAGQLRPDAGTVTLLGHPAWGPTAFRRRVGYCPEHSAVFDWMSGEEFVTTLLRVDGYSRAEARARTKLALTTVDLLDDRHRRLRAYSKGMRQRIKIAQAIAHDPQLLLLDEPLNGVDPVGRADLLMLFADLARDGHHLIISSHVLYEVERLTSEIVMITNGRALAQGNVHQIRELISNRPHTIELTTADPRALARALAGWEHVTAIQFPGPGRLTVLSTTPAAFYQGLPELVVREGIDVTGVRGADDNLDAVFRYLAGTA